MNTPNEERQASAGQVERPLGPLPERATAECGALVLRSGAAVWRDGEPTNLEAAAEDADEWLALIERLNAAGRWPFSERDSSAKLSRCRGALRRFLRPNVPMSQARDTTAEARDAVAPRLDGRVKPL